MRPTQIGTAEPRSGETHKQGIYLDRWGPNIKLVAKRGDQKGKVGEGHDQRGGVN